MIAENLGPYVIARERADGTYRVCFEVPARLRPEGWPATIPLPRDNRSGRLEDLNERARIRVEAEALLLELKSRSMGHSTKGNGRTWPELVALWQRSTDFNNNKEATQRNYIRYSNYILKYFEQHPGITPSEIVESQVDAVFANWAHSPDMKLHIQSVFRNLMHKAVKEKWRADDPSAEIPFVFPQRTVRLWEQDDVSYLGEASIEAEQRGIAGIISTVWEIGQRLTDTRLFRDGVEYVDGVFRFFQSKTDSYVTLPASPELREIISASVSEEGYLFVDSADGKPFSEESLGQKFRRIRDAHPRYKENPLRLRNLRHSCVVQLARAGCDVPEIASITGHSLNTVHVILQTYLPRDNVVAFNAMEKRRRMMLGDRTHLTAPTVRTALAPGLRRRNSR